MLRVYPVEHGCAVDLRSVQLGLVMLPVSRYITPAFGEEIVWGQVSETSFFGSDLASILKIF
ncbi:hypothetical protein Dthio_PD3520 [Desulfonatronospira thiodismutans ASO3-1]|uniref:Uncharacterized protein n=1 Tax=Desulfonatronospira thiodismutans ASO3-1 TaxID=555779 RepID=D6SN12_9BACT|nr:hypothetical protein Dthio_PD3520 [Desulfonatronospira thiodismutans ASO3-1]